MTDGQRQVIEIKDGVILRVFLWLGLVYLLYLIKNIVAVVVFAVVIASAVEPAAEWFKKKGIHRIFGVLITYILAFSVLVAAFSFIIPPLFDELSAFSSGFSQFIRTTDTSGDFFKIIPDLPSSISVGIDNIIVNLKSSISGLSGGFFQAASAIFGGALAVVMITVISFYLSAQESGIEDFLSLITPDKYENYILDLWKRSRRKIGRWFQGQILMGLLVGVLVYLGLTILQVRFALPLAVLSAIFELVPIFGPIMAAIPAVIIALLQDPVLGLFALILFIVVQQIENHLLYPIVMRKATGVPPIIVILAIIIGGQLGGFFGILLAVPIATVLVEISNDVAAKKHPAAV